MKTNLKSAVILTFLLLILVSVIYPMTVRLVAYLAPGHGRGVTVEKNGKVVGYAIIGQKFTQDKYFWSRPSAVDYNAAGSGGSNRGPSNPDLLKDVQSRMDTFLLHNPTVRKSEVPSELVTASGSGLDPDLSPAAAYIQVQRVAKARNLSAVAVNDLVHDHVKGPLLGLFGPAHVNVLELNVALDGVTVK